MKIQSKNTTSMTSSGSLPPAVLQGARWNFKELSSLGHSTALRNSQDFSIIPEAIIPEAYISIIPEATSHGLQVSPPKLQTATSRKIWRRNHWTRRDMERCDLQASRMYYTKRMQNNKFSICLPTQIRINVISP